MGEDTKFSYEYRQAWRRYLEVEEPKLTETDRDELDIAEYEIASICKTNRVRLELFTRRNVVALGPTLKYSDQQERILNQPCIGVFVSQKVLEEHLSIDDIIPKEIEGIPTDVIQVGIPSPSQYKAKNRPTRPGWSIGYGGTNSSGTLGCLVEDNDTRELLILSCNHVIANYNVCNKGDEILQPGPSDGGTTANDVIAELESWEPLIEETFGRNLVDAAVAKPRDASQLEAHIEGLGFKPTGVGRPRSRLSVHKVGKETGLTRGVVASPDAEVWPLHYPTIGSVGFVRSIITSQISQPGDSGSLLLDQSNGSALGILYSDGNGFSFYSNIAEVLKVLKVRLVP